eukprot:3734483-Rhodomonas_salina.2
MRLSRSDTWRASRPWTSRPVSRKASSREQRQSSCQFLREMPCAGIIEGWLESNIQASDVLVARLEPLHGVSIARHCKFFTRS